jgi:3-oxoacyl-[acyl-carrier protein] reductase
MRLTDKVAIITGAGSGFGKGIAETFAREGAMVAVVDVVEAAAQEVAASIGPNAIAVRADVSSRGDIEGALKATVAAFGKIDILINNAGTSHLRKPMLDITDAEFERVFAVNVKGLFFFCQQVVPLFCTQGGGVIINIGSTAGLRPRGGLSVYNASKGAVHLLSKALAIELAPDKIRVCVIAPVAGETPLLPTFMGGDTDELRKQFRDSVPLGRLSTPQDIANVALFLASDEAEFLTGNVVEVDGGRCV